MPVQVRVTLHAEVLEEEYDLPAESSWLSCVGWYLCPYNRQRPIYEGDLFQQSRQPGLLGDNLFSCRATPENSPMDACPANGGGLGLQIDEKERFFYVLREYKKSATSCAEHSNASTHEDGPSNTSHWSI